MSTESILKSLGRETKALIIVSEFEARRMPMFQLRSVLNEIVSNEEEKKIIIDLVENDLKATGYHPNQITAFLQDLLNEAPAAANDPNLRATRRLRSPFAHGFEEQTPVKPGAGAPAPAPAPTPAPAFTGGGIFGKLTQGPAPAAPPGHPAPSGTPAVAPASGPVPSSPVLPSATPGQPSMPAGGTESKPLNLKLPVPPPRMGGAAQASKPAVIPKVPFNAPPSVTKGTPIPTSGTRVSGAAGPTVKESVYFGGSLSTLHVESKPTILLADDDKRIRIVFRLCLERMGYRVLEAEDGNEAWKKIQEGGLSLACLDMKMPGLHGLEVLTRIVNKQIDLPIIICSAYDQLKDEFVVATYPKLRYLIKPVASEALEKAVKELVGAPAQP